MRIYRTMRFIILKRTTWRWWLVVATVIVAEAIIATSFVNTSMIWWWFGVVTIMVIYRTTIVSIVVISTVRVRSLMLIISLFAMFIAMMSVVVLFWWLGGTRVRLGRVRAPAPLFYVSIIWHVANNWMSNNENSKTRYRALLLTSTYCIIVCLWGKVSMYDESALLVLYWLYIILDSFRV